MTTPFSVNNADPRIINHAIHWVLSNECYTFTPRANINNWIFNKIYSSSDTLCYSFNEKTIFAFRGSVNAYDIKVDILISKNPDNNPKVPPAVKLINTYFEDYPDQEVQVTGHSLGGAVARSVGKILELGCITFNGASPPTAPTITSNNEIDYHIVFDIISAWDHPSVIRIDKNYRPATKGFGFINNFLTIGIKPMFDAHKIDNFSNKKSGNVITANDENQIWQKWYINLNARLRQLFNKFTQTSYLPPVV